MREPAVLYVIVLYFSLSPRARVTLQYLGIFAEDFRRHTHNIPSVEERQPQIVVSATTGNAV